VGGSVLQASAVVVESMRPYDNQMGVMVVSDDDVSDALPVCDTPEEGDGLGEQGFKYAVRLVNVSRVYEMGSRSIVALKDVNLEVLPGEFVVVEGPSGSGKTTLLNIIGAIDHATSGRVLLMDVPIQDYDETFRATFRLTNTGFIFQSYNLISTFTALENVMFPMQLGEAPLPLIQERARELLDRVGLSDRSDHLPWQLSSGEQQRVAVARALANDPPMILADEPTANLDNESAEIVRSLLREIHDEGRTVIVMTHDPAIIKTSVARHFRMRHGELSEIV